jgi:hypothetical protein
MIGRLLFFSELVFGGAKGCFDKFQCLIPKNNWFAKITWNKVGEIQNIADFPDDFFRK